jgi:hypothetical protein
MYTMCVGIVSGMVMRRRLIIHIFLRDLQNNKQLSMRMLVFN